MNESLEKTLKEIQGKLKLVDTRLSKVESILSSSPGLQTKQHSQIVPSDDSGIPVFKISGLSESKIGEHGLAWLGNIVLLFGITFMTQYVQKIGYPLLAGVIGYFAVACIIGLSFLIRKSLKTMAFAFKILSYLLIYYFTLRLHFYSGTPLLESKTICLLLLIVVNIVQLYLSVKQNSKVIGVIALFLAVTTGIISNSTYFLIPVVTATSLLSLILLFRYKWQTLFIISQILTYASLVFWVFNNSLTDQTSLRIYSLVFLFANAVIYSIASLIRKDDSVSKDFVYSAVFLNGFFFSVQLILIVLTFFETNYNWIFISLFLYCFAYSVILKSRSDWDFTSSFYAVCSFIALSVAVYGFYEFPGAFLFLSIESLLVVSMALWFRSKQIVIMNLLLYITLLIAYLTLSNFRNEINFAFTIVALATPRILYLNRKRLGIETDFLQNTYHIAAFVMVLFSLYKIVPGQYVTLSWIGAALFYFLLSLLLRNKKYRWMAISIIIVSAFYLFIVDMEQIELIYRVVAFLVFAVISIAISIIYTKRREKPIE